MPESWTETAKNYIAETNEAAETKATRQASLAALEAQMAESCVAIAAARRDVVARLRGALAAGIGPFPSADMTVRGDAEDMLADSADIYEVSN